MPGQKCSKTCVAWRGGLCLASTLFYIPTDSLKKDNYLLPHKGRTVCFFLWSIEPCIIFLSSPPSGRRRLHILFLAQLFSRDFRQSCNPRSPSPFLVFPPLLHFLADIKILDILYHTWLYEQILSSVWAVPRPQRDDVSFVSHDFKLEKLCLFLVRADDDHRVLPATERPVLRAVLQVILDFVAQLHQPLFVRL